MAHESECPLCHRNFDNDNDYEDLKNEVGVFFSKPSCPSEFAVLQERELPALKARVDCSNARLEELKGEIDKETAKLEVIQADQSIAQSLQGDIAVMEKFEKEISDMTRSIQRLKPDSTSDGGYGAVAFIGWCCVFKYWLSQLSDVYIFTRVMDFQYLTKARQQSRNGD
ncbi:unnamed protein product [Dibothriocephalus latus]|uniref:Zinc-hook domain-containing protein n=1 Tax=Dibothriocephalus latus TaxID=60516 RepID=A0A3P7QI41_DIBLA|nr:unnamed protein product [Dibothriocephalus latus]